MASPRERDHRGDAAGTNMTRWPGNRQPLPVPVPAPRRWHHFHDVPPWPHQRYHDYAPVEGWGWWPRWYPYWDAHWRAYWWNLYDYYGGDGQPEYAEYARDAFLRANAPQWGLAVGGGYGTPQVGIQAYGVEPVVSRYNPRGYGRPGRGDSAAAYRGVALEAARKIYAVTGGFLFGYRDSPWGSELTAFGTRAGLQRWANEQAADTDVWYAATFDLGASSSPLSEVSR